MMMMVVDIDISEASVVFTVMFRWYNFANVSKCFHGFMISMLTINRTRPVPPHLHMHLA